MASYNHYQPENSAIWTITHNLNTNFIAIDTMKLIGNGVYEKVLPDQVELTTENSVTVYFLTPVTGRARIVA